MEVEFPEPLGVVPKLNFLHVENNTELFGVCFHVNAHLILREHRSLRVFIGGVADKPGEISDDEDDLMPEFLKRAQFPERNRATDVQLRSSRVDAELHAKFFAASKFFLEVAAVNDINGA